MNYSQTTNPLITDLINGTLPGGIISPTAPPTPNPVISPIPSNPTNVRLLSLTTSAAAQTSITAQINSQNQEEWLSQFAIYKSELQNPSFIPEGIWDMNIFARSPTAADADHISLKYHLYGITVDGVGTITIGSEIGSGSSSQFVTGNNTINVYTLSLLVPYTNISAYDALYVIVTATNNVATNHDTVIYFESSATYSHIHTSFGVYGFTGPTGPQSTVTGPTGPQSTVTGPTGYTGPQSTVTGPTGPQSTVTGPTGFTGPSVVVYWSPTGPTGIYYNYPIISYNANSSVTIGPTGIIYVKAGIQEAVGYQSGSFASPFTYTLWSDYYYNYIYITSLSSAAGTIGTITLPAITGADDGRYVQFRRTGGTSSTSQAQAALQIVVVNSPATNIIGIDNTIFNTPLNTVNLTGTQLMRKFQIATFSGTSYWFISNDA